MKYTSKFWARYNLNSNSLAERILNFNKKSEINFAPIFYKGTFGHAGIGGSVAFGDIKNQIGYSFVCNKQQKNKIVLYRRWHSSYKILSFIKNKDSSNGYARFR